MNKIVLLSALLMFSSDAKNVKSELALQKEKDQQQLRLEEEKDAQELRLKIIALIGTISLAVVGAVVQIYLKDK